MSKLNCSIEVDHPVLLGGRGHELVQIDVRSGRPDYVTPDGTEVRLERKGQKTRFLDAHGDQVGPAHANLAPSIVWARAQKWRDPSLPDWFNDGAIAEAAADGADRNER
jgi:hypothetical protein